ncbi:MAG: DUF896 domain-containing protein [Anaerovoracaceae bacterium]
MGQDKIDRINQLSKKSKAEGLTEEEKSEQKILRDEYIAAFRENLKVQLDQIEFVEDVEASKGVDKGNIVVEIEENLN